MEYVLRKAAVPARPGISARVRTEGGIYTYMPYKTRRLQNVLHAMYSHYVFKARNKLSVPGCWYSYTVSGAAQVLRRLPAQVLDPQPCVRGHKLCPWSSGGRSTAHATQTGSSARKIILAPVLSAGRVLTTYDQEDHHHTEGGGRPTLGCFYLLLLRSQLTRRLSAS